MRFPLKFELLEDRRLLATFAVTNLLDGPVNAAGELPGSLRQAIFDANQAPGADDVDLTGVSGVLSLSSGALNITGPVEINGPGQASLTIDSAHASRIFNIDDPSVSNESFPVTIQGMTLTRGLASGGPGNGGGAIRALGEISLTIANAAVTNSIAGGSGGAVDAYELELVNSTVSGNSGGSGGGVSGFSVNITNSSVENNTATYGPGGGIAGQAVQVLTSTISGNSTAGLGAYGGGIGAYGNISVTNSTITGNTTTGNTLYGYYLSRASHGGGVASYAGNITLTNSTVSGNSVTGGGALGGGLAAFQGAVVARHSTIAYNVTGGILAPLGGITLDHTIVAENTGAAQIETLALIDAAYSLLGNIAGLTASQVSGITSGPGNIVDVDPLLGQLQNNGGSTATHALLTDSPAIDAGNPAFAAPPALDQRGTGFDRVRDGNGDTVSRVDIGAFEVQSSAEPPSADFDEDGDIDGRDFLAWQRGFGTSPAVKADGDADNDTDVDGDDLTIWQDQFGQSTPLVATLAVGETVESESLLVSTLEDPLASYLATLDAAMALNLFEDGDDAKPDPLSETLSDQEMIFDLIFANYTVLPWGASPEEFDVGFLDSNDAEKIHEAWLSDELLEQVFG